MCYFRWLFTFALYFWLARKRNFVEEFSESSAKLEIRIFNRDDPCKSWNKESVKLIRI